MRSPPGTGQDQIDFRFAKPQGGFGLFYRSPRGTSLTVTVLDSQETVLEEVLFPDSEGYAGMIRPRAEIGIVRKIGRAHV